MGDKVIKRNTVFEIHVPTPVFRTLLVQGVEPRPFNDTFTITVVKGPYASTFYVGFTLKKAAYKSFNQGALIDVDCGNITEDLSAWDSDFADNFRYIIHDTYFDPDYYDYHGKVTGEIEENTLADIIFDDTTASGLKDGYSLLVNDWGGDIKGTLYPPYTIETTGFYIGGTGDPNTHISWNGLEQAEAAISAIKD